MIKYFNNYFEKKDIQNLQDTSAYVKDDTNKYVKTTEPLEIIQITGLLSEEEAEKIQENIFNNIKDNITSFTQYDDKLNKFIYNVNNEISEYFNNNIQHKNIKNINTILTQLYKTAEKNNTMRISDEIINKLITLYGVKTNKIIFDIIVYEYFSLKKLYNNIHIDENMTIDKSLNVGEVKRGQIIWLTALLKKPGSSYTNQTLGVLKLRIIDYYYGLNKLNQVMK